MRAQSPSLAPLLQLPNRSETAGEKPSFQEAWQQHRCVIPASYYFEWEHLTGLSGQKKVGDKFMLQPKNETMTWLAGIYRMEEGLPVFTVLTREPSEGIAHIHDRMPLILTHEQVRPWLTSDQDALQLLTIVPAPLIKTRKDGQLRFEDYINS